MFPTPEQPNTPLTDETAKSLIIKTQASGEVATLRLYGNFCYSTRNEFFTALRECLHFNEPSRIVFDLSSLNHIDTSALGMLLIAIDKAGKNRTLSIRNPNKSIGEVLKITEFDRYFHIE